MEIVFLLLLPAALWAHAWYMLGYYTNPKTLGLIAGIVAIALLGLVLFKQDIIIVSGTEGPFTALVLVWAVYAVLIAGVGLWGFEERAVGFYSLFLWVVSLVFVGYYFLGGDLLSGGGAATLSWLLGLVSLVLSVLAAFLFFYLAFPLPRLRMVTGWFFLILSIIVALLGGLLVLGISP